MKHQIDSVAAFITTRRIQLSLARQAAQRTFAIKGPDKSRYTTFYLALIAFICMIPLSACNSGKSSILTIDWSHSEPSSATQVYAKNSSLDSISTGQYYSIAVGGTSHIVGISSDMPNVNNPGSFDISRKSHPLARVSFQVLRFPAPTDPWKSVYINITEEPAGVFGAAIPDSSSTWIKVSIQPL